MFSEVMSQIKFFRRFGILMEEHTEIEHVLRPALFMDFMQYSLVIPFQLFWITNRSYFMVHMPKNKCHNRRQPTHTGCLLEEMTITAAYIVIAYYEGSHSFVYIFKEKL